MHRALTLGWGCMLLIHGALGLTMGLSEESAGMVFPVTDSCHLDEICNTVNRICIPLMPSESSICCLSSLFPFFSVIVQNSMLLMLQERNEALWKHPAQLRKLNAYSHPFPFPHRKNLGKSFLALSYGTLEEG